MLKKEMMWFGALIAVFNDTTLPVHHGSMHGRES